MGFDFVFLISRMRLLLLLCIIGVLGKLVECSPITNPHLENGDISKIIPDYFDSKTGSRVYHNSTPAYLNEAHEFTLSHVDKDSSCSLNFHLKWTAHVGSPVYATPLIFPSGPEGRKEIFVSTFYDYVEVLGDDGYKPWGWPMAFEESTFLGSPILFDIDADGKDDVGVVDKNGNLFFIRLGEYGQYLEDFHTQVPRLRVKKSWADGISDNYVDSYAMLSMFDHETNSLQSSIATEGNDNNNNNNNKNGNNEIDGKGKKSRPGSAKSDEVSSTLGDVLLLCTATGLCHVQ